MSELNANLFKQFKVSKIFKDSKEINALDMDDSGNYLLTCADDDCIKIYDLMNGKLVHTVNSKKYGCALARFTHHYNNVLFASTKQDDTIRYVSCHDNKFVRYFKGHKDRFYLLI